MSNATEIYLRFLKTPTIPPLGPGPRAEVTPLKELQSQLEAAQKETRMAGGRAELVRAVVLLWHDYLDQAHEIAQQIENADGSFVHAIMHRREPDYNNAKYWFRRVGKHPTFEALAERARGISPGASFVKRGWDPFAFVDACEGAKPVNQELPRIQAAESEILLCYLTAAAA